MKITTTKGIRYCALCREAIPKGTTILVAGGGFRAKLDNLCPNCVNVPKFKETHARAYNNFLKKIKEMEGGDNNAKSNNNHSGQQGSGSNGSTGQGV